MQARIGLSDCRSSHGPFPGRLALGAFYTNTEVAVFNLYYGNNKVKLSNLILVMKWDWLTTMIRPRGLFRNDVTQFWTFLDPYPPPCHQEPPFDEPPPTPPLGDVICEQPFSQT